MTCVAGTRHMSVQYLQLKINKLGPELPPVFQGHYTRLGFVIFYYFFRVRLAGLLVAKKDHKVEQLYVCEVAHCSQINQHSTWRRFLRSNEVRTFINRFMSFLHRKMLEDSEETLDE